MNTFQWVTIPVLSVLLVREFIGFIRQSTSRITRLVRCIVWAGAITAIANPAIPQIIAESVGITRGADLVFYLFVLAFLGTSFTYYANHVRLQRQVTDLVRHLAILEAQRGEAPRVQGTIENNG
jgi:hypothetical protein